MTATPKKWSDKEGFHPSSNSLSAKQKERLSIILLQKNISKEIIEMLLQKIDKIYSEYQMWVKEENDDERSQPKLSEVRAGLEKIIKKVGKGTIKNPYNHLDDLTRGLLLDFAIEYLLNKGVNLNSPLGVVKYVINELNKDSNFYLKCANQLNEDLKHQNFPKEADKILAISLAHSFSDLELPLTQTSNEHSDASLFYSILLELFSFAGRKKTVKDFGQIAQKSIQNSSSKN